MENIVVCPIDKSPLVKKEEWYLCEKCASEYKLNEYGIMDLYYSNLPDVDGHVPYIWSDVFYLENILKQLLKPGMVVLEVCSGPNIVIPLLLRRLAINVSYYSVGSNEVHLLQQKRGVNFAIQSIVGDATELPIKDNSIDIYIGHHAINDIWLTKGIYGVERSYEEMHRVIKDDAFIIHSDCVLQHDSRVGDPSTKIVNLQGLSQFLKNQNYFFIIENGGEMDWLIANKSVEFNFVKSSEFSLD